MTSALRFTDAISMPSLDWREPPESLNLLASTTHLWRIDLDRIAADDLLSIDERERALRFKHEEPRRRFIAGRSALRTILGRYVATPASQLRFVYGRWGKPALASSEVAFNLSHSHDLALLAVRRSGAVGVDVERLDPSPDHGAIAAECFSAADARRVAIATASERTATFLTLWTRRESVLKAAGVGLAGPADHPCDVQSFEPAPGFIAALAVGEHVSS